MPVSTLINELQYYCAKKFPNIYDIEALDISLSGKYGVLNSRITIMLNKSVCFDYIAGTPFDNYDHIFKGA